VKSSIAHSIKHREKPNDDFNTPVELVKNLIKLVPLKPNDIVCDNAFGTGNFYNNLPDFTINQYSKDFYNWQTKQNWFITNPPYSNLDDWLEHSCQLAIEGFAYLLGLHNLTPRRIEMCERYGFKISSIHLCKVFKWFGISAFIVWRKKQFHRNIKLTYDRKVWR